MTTMLRRWGKRLALTILVLLGAAGVAVAAMPDLRQGIALVWIYNANSLFPSDEWRADGNADTISFRWDRHVLVSATVQGEREITIALDTGAPMSALIDGPHLEGVSLNTGRTVQIGGAGQGVTPTARVLSDLQLAVGAVEYGDLTALLIPWRQMGEFFQRPEQVYIHGILGYDLFSRYVVELDFQGEQLTLHRPDDFEYDGDGVVVPLLFDQRKPMVEAMVTQLDGSTVPVRLHLDLGKPAPLSLIPSETSGIVVPPNALEAEGRGLSGTVVERLSRVSTLRFGDQALDDVVTSFSIEGYTTSGERNGVVGVEALARFRVIIDYPRERMILERVEYDVPFEDDMSGITWVPQGNRYAVWQVRADSPADTAGLRADDELIAIDGVDASSIRFGDLYDRMRSGDGVEVELELRRGDERIAVVLTLKRRI